MFEELFGTPETVERYRSAPHAHDRIRYLEHRADSGAPRSTLQKIANAQLHLVQLLELTARRKVKPSQIDAAAQKWSRLNIHWYGRSASPEATTLFRGLAVRWLHFLGRLDEPKQASHAHAGQVAAFAAWMRAERGLSDHTIQNNCRTTNGFFDWIAEHNIPLASVSLTDIDKWIAAIFASGKHGRRSIRVYAQRLRAFIAFAEGKGWCRVGMAAGIMAPKFYPDEDVPRGLSRKDVDRLLVSTEGDRPCDKRARAILMLLIAYGLRAGEVAGLQLDDLDWENETIQVRRPKSGRTAIYPLSRGVGQAIIRYIRDVRPLRPEREVFFTLNAPFRPLGPNALGGVVTYRVVSLGIVARHRGPHALRHAAAQHLLDQGMSMKVIGDFLGHRRASSTAVYAKVNLNALREVAELDLGGLA